MLIGSSGVEARRPPSHRGVIDTTGAGDDLVPLVLPEEHGPFERRHLAVDLVDHLHVVGVLERRGGDEHPAAGLVEGVGELVGPVRRVDVDEDDADVGGGVLQQRPLGVVRAPQPDPVADLQTETEQPGAEPVDALAELGVASSGCPGGGRRSASLSPWAAIVRRRLAPIVSSRSGTSVGPLSMASSPAMPAMLARSDLGDGVAGRRVDDERLPRRHR